MPVTLNARRRSERGKNAARQLRREGEVPGVVYGHNDETVALAISKLELEKLLSSISVENTLIELNVEGDAPAQALIREVQWHPAKPLLLHVDLYKVHAGEKIHLQIPVRLTGVPVGVREGGGVLQQVIHEVEVECLPMNIPEAAVLDVDGLKVGDVLHVRDFRMPDTRILLDDDQTVCSVVAPSTAALPETPEDEEGVGGAVEPELIGDREDDAEDVPATEGGQET